ncbi:MAG: xcpT 13 [Planctomycetota bacterium]|nr:xcpT 13 [Planctomycetota bacterium]
MRTRDRKGLALVEFVTLIGVGFVALGVILPQIQSLREAAKRAQCTNNLKQMGLAMHNYAASNGTLPMSATQGPGHGNGHSGFTAILPYLEQPPLYNSYNFDLENWHAANATTVAARVMTYLCPSNKIGDPVPASDVRTAHDKPYAGKNKFERGHYGMNWGGVRKASGAEQEKAYGDSWRGVLLTVVDPDSKVPTKNVKFIDIVDGMSFTIAIVEKRDSFGWGVGGWGGSEFDVNTDPIEPGKDPMARRVFTGSEHPTGINVLFCDGSVRLLTSKIDRDVWYALTTRAGGEEIKPGSIK